MKIFIKNKFEFYSFFFSLFKREKKRYFDRKSPKTRVCRHLCHFQNSATRLRYLFPPRTPQKFYDTKTKKDCIALTLREARVPSN